MSINVSIQFSIGRPSGAQIRLLLLALAVLVAAILRFYRLGDLPPGLLGDEAASGLEAQRVLEEGWIGPWSGIALGQPSGIFYWMAVLLDWFPNQIYTLRAATAVLGVLTIPLFYLFCRALFGSRAAILGTVLLALSCWHIYYSRIAFPVVSLPLMEVLSLFLLFHAFRASPSSHKQIMLFAAGGLAFGAAAYSYTTFPVFLIAVAVLWLREMLLPETSRRVVLARGLVFFIPALLISLPFLDFFFADPTRVLNHSRAVVISNLPEYQELEQAAEKARFLLGNVGKVGTIFFRGHAIDSSDGMGRLPLLDPVTASLASLGLFLSFWRLGDRRHLLLWAGVLAAVIGTALTIPQGENRRIIPALPFIFASAGFALHWLLGWLQGRIPPRAIYPLVAVLLLFVLWHNTDAYFGTLVHSPEVRWTFGSEMVEAAEYLNGLDGKPYVYFYSPRWSYKYETLQYLVSDLAGGDRSREFGDYSVERDSQHGSVVYLVMPPYQGVITLATSLYPDGELFEERDQEDRLLFAAYYLPLAPEAHAMPGALISSGGSHTR